MTKEDLAASLEAILAQYRDAFAEKVYGEESDRHDLLMDVFGITPEQKRENRQYWGRELGMCWQRLVTALCKETCAEFAPALRFGQDEPCDLVVGRKAIDTKYRVGSGDSGTLKKFKQYGELLQGKGYHPLLLVIREDNLPAAITAFRAGGWEVRVGDETYALLRELTGFDVAQFLAERAGAFSFPR